MTYPEPAHLLAPFPPEDIVALLREAVDRRPGHAPAGRERRTAMAASALAALEPRLAWRLLAAACDQRIADLRTGQERRLEGATPTPWVQILWDNAVVFTAWAGDLDPAAAAVARDLVADAGWTGTLKDLTETVRAITA